MIFVFVDWMKTTTTSCDDIQVVDDFGKHVVLPQRHCVISSGFPLTIKMAAFRSNDKKIMRDDVGLLSRLLTKKTVDTCTSTREKKQDLGCHSCCYCVIFWKIAVLPAYQNPDTPESKNG
jgi:hypothetical protein